MKVFRGNVPKSEFTLIMNQVWKDQRLSSHAVRILGYLLSLPTGFDTDRHKIMKTTSISDYHYRIAWEQLCTTGHVRQWRERSDDWFVEVTSVVAESHVTESHVTESHVTESHVTESHVTESHVNQHQVLERRTPERRTSRKTKGRNKKVQQDVSVKKRTVTRVKKKVPREVAERWNLNDLKNRNKKIKKGSKK